jgi:hypothetical protein
LGEREDVEYDLVYNIESEMNNNSVGKKKKKNDEE